MLHIFYDSFMFGRLKSFLLILGDLGILFLSLWLTVLIFREGRIDTEFYIKHLYPFGIVFSFWILTYFIEGLYSLRTFSPEGLSVSLIRTQLFNSIITFVYFYLFPYEGITPKTNVFILALISAILIFLFRKLFYALFSYKGLKLKTLIIGNENLAKDVEISLKQKPYLGFDLVSTASTTDIHIDEHIDLVAVDRNQYTDQEFLKRLIDGLNRGMNIVELTKFSELVTGKIPVSALNESWFVENCGMQPDQGYKLAKGAMDKLAALIVLLIALPIYIVLIPLLLIFSGRPLFYSQIRTGYRNKPFRIYKLRTMTVNAEKDGAQWATPKDSRVTPIGKFLRKSRLDELPQLWNILNGTMSIVGPRPERPEMIKDKLEKNIPFYNFRHLVKPGVTGWAQVNFRYGFSEEDSIEKMQYDLYYVKNKSIWMDIKIVLKTIKTVVTGMGH